MKLAKGRKLAKGWVEFLDASSSLASNKFESNIRVCRCSSAIFRSRRPIIDGTFGSGEARLRSQRAEDRTPHRDWLVRTVTSKVFTIRDSIQLLPLEFCSPPRRDAALSMQVRENTRTNATREVSFAKRYGQSSYPRCKTT